MHLRGLLLLTTLLAACGGPDISRAVESPRPEPMDLEPEPEGGCVDGQVGGCRCEDGASGQMTCVDGSFTACACAAPACVEGQSLACACEDGSAGAQVCSGGQYGACACEPAISECVPGQSVGCACADGAAGQQVCGADGTFEACACPEPEPPSCLEAQCGAEVGFCDVGCQWAMGCLERCGTAGCRYHCFDDLNATQRAQAQALWDCSAACTGRTSVVPAGYPQLPIRGRCAAEYHEDASQFGEAPRDVVTDECGYPFGEQTSTIFGRGFQAAFGSTLRDYLTIEIDSLDPGTYEAEPQGAGTAGLRLRLRGIGGMSSENTAQPLPVVHVDGNAEGLVWGRFEGGVCGYQSCAWVGGRFTSHTQW